MTKNTKVDEKIEGDDNFRAWKYRMLLILEENELKNYVVEEVAEPKGDEAKANHEKNMVEAKIIITDSINPSCFIFQDCK